MIELRGISKSFAGIRVLRDIRFGVPPGATLGLVGENGAGKSTLMNILGGSLQPDAGDMLLGEKPYRPTGPLDAARQGVAFIHQELNLFPNLSIAENLFLTEFPRAGRLPWIDRATLRRQTKALLGEVGLEIPADTLVERLSAGERQLVEIAKALGIDARLVLFDEPTTSLTRAEANRLFTLIGRLRQWGLSLVYISHHLEDVLRLCDEIVVLRDGECVGAGPRSEFTEDRLVSLMVGREIKQLFPPRAKLPEASPALVVRHLSQPGIVSDIDFTLHRGEVLGFRG